MSKGEGQVEQLTRTPPEGLPEQATMAGMALGRGGSAFELAEAPRRDHRVQLGAWSVEARKGVRLVVVRGRGGSYATVMRAARKRAEEAIDLLSVRGLEDLALRKPGDEHVAWWTDPNGLTIRVVSRSTLTATVGELVVTVRDAHGRIVRPARTSPPRWHDSYRFFRLSQTTNDLFDAYRNAYLALESVLSQVAPQHLHATGKPAESDGNWFRRALVASGVNLGDFTSRPSGDPAGALYDELYQGLRATVFHAKSNRPALLPRHEPNRAQVLDGLKRIRRLYLAIVERTLGLRHLEGGISAMAARTMLSAVFDDMRVVVCADESAADLPAPVVSPENQSTVALPNMEAPCYQGFGASKLAWAMPDALASIPFIRSVVATGPDGAAHVTNVLEGRLVLGDARRLEVMFAANIANTRELRNDYA
jgi:hypothetical protein